MMDACDAELMSLRAELTAERDRADRESTALRARAEQLEELVRCAGASLDISVDSPQDLILHIGLLEDRAEKAEAQLAAVREALEGCLTPDKEGKLHEQDCIGLHGYDCKAWCASTRDLLSSTEQAARDWEAGIRAEERERVAVRFDGLCPFPAALARHERGGLPYHDSCAECRAARIVRAPSKEVKP